MNRSEKDPGDAVLRRVVQAWISLQVLLQVEATALAAPPSNDNFVNRIELTGSQAEFVGTSIDATTEPGEPLFQTYGQGAVTVSEFLSHTVWWTWRAPEDGILWVWGRSDDPDVGINVFEEGDSLAALVPRGVLAKCRSRDPNIAMMQVLVEAGKCYAIRAGSPPSYPHRRIQGWISFGPPVGVRELRGLPALFSYPARGPGIGFAGPYTPALLPASFSWVSPVTGPVTFHVAVSPMDWPQYYFPNDLSSGYRPSLSVWTGGESTPRTRSNEGAVLYLHEWGPFSPYAPLSVAQTVDVIEGTEYHVHVDDGQVPPGTIVTCGVREGAPPVIDLVPFPLGAFGRAVFPQGTPVRLGALVYEAIPPATPREVEFLAFCAKEKEPMRRVVVQAPPYTVTWTNLPVGEYTLMARVVDATGVLATTAPTLFEVTPDNDLLEHARSFTGRSVTVAGSVFPYLCDQTISGTAGGCVVWWEWTAPEDGVYTFTPEVPDAVADGLGHPVTLEVFDRVGAGTTGLSLLGAARGVSAYSQYRGGVDHLTLNTLAGHRYPIRVTPDALIPNNFPVSGLALRTEYEIHVTPGPPAALRITSPAAGSTNSLESPPPFAIEVPNRGVQVNRVLYYWHSDGEYGGYVSDILMGAAYTPPFSIDMPRTFAFVALDGCSYGTTWYANQLVPASYTIVAKAFLSDGSVAVSDPVTFRLQAGFASTPPSPAAPPAVPPSNDLFAARVPLGESNVWFTGSGAGATKEPVERFSQLWGHGSVWWSFTPSVTGPYTLVAEGIREYAVMSGGALASLTPVASGVAVGPRYRVQATFAGQAGTEYPIALGASGPLRVRVAPGTPPKLAFPRGDSLMVYQGRSIHLEVSPTDAEGSVTNVTYYLNGTAIGSATVSPFSIDYVAHNGVGPYSLTAIATDETGLESVPTPALELDVMTPPPGNDDFSGRFAMGDSVAWFTGTGVAATTEVGEPPQFTSSVWWSFTPSHSGPYTLVTEGADAVGIYTGNTLPQLTPVAGQSPVAWDSTVQTVFEATAGLEYSIELNGYWDIRLRVAPGTPPSVAIGDGSPIRAVNGRTVRLYANPTDAEGTVTNVDFFLNGTLIGRSTAPPFAIDYGAPNTLGSYPLTAVATDDTGLASHLSPVVSLLVVLPPPTNDDFASRLTIPATPGRVQGTGLGSTRDPGETWAGPGPGDVWYSWSAPREGDYAVIVTPATTNRQVTVHLFRGGATIASLERLGDATTPQAALPWGGRVPGAGVGFDAAEGETFFFAVEAADGFALRIREGHVPAITLEGIPDTLPGVVPLLSPWRFHATVSADPGIISRVLMSSLGNGLAGKLIPTEFTNAPFDAVIDLSYASGLEMYRWPETLYVVAAAIDTDGAFWESPLVPVANQFVPPVLPNDSFANRTLLTGAVVSVVTPPGQASLESGEPVHAPGVESSAWWSWVAPANGSLVPDSAYFLFYFEVFRGADLRSLTRLTNAASYRVTQGETYSFAMVSQYSWIEGLGLAFHLVPDRLVFPGLREDGSFEFELPTLPDGKWRVEASSNLIDWAPLETPASSAAFDGLNLHDVGSTGIPHRFYRTVQTP